MSDELYLVQRRCKCGRLILCNWDCEERNGDIIDHEDCVLKDNQDTKEGETK